MAKFEELREQYKEFIYKDYHVELGEDACRIVYDFEIPNLAEFHPTWEFPISRKVDETILHRMAFNLGMVEMISYYKITCPKTIRILVDNLSTEQQAWWKKLFYNGLGEFMYINHIEISQEDLFGFVCAEADEEPLHDEANYEGCIVPVGGGKDSVVSLELMKNEKIATYHINYGSAIREVIDFYPHKERDLYAKRTLDKKMLELNQQGYLNGHTPFSAIVAFSTVIQAYLTGKKYIALSNETSANESTVKGSFVNHQYSKSVEFEQDFQWYFETMTDSDIHYFSLLRPLSEMQIAALFSQFKEYHTIFRSCNVGSKTGIWCGNCPKCLFVYIILCAFLSDEELKNIFGEDLLDKESMDQYFRELCGIEDNKPFECVGTRLEVLVALKTYTEQGRSSLLTERYREHIMAETTTMEELLHHWVEENQVPAQYQAMLKEKLESVSIVR